MAANEVSDRGSRADGRHQVSQRLRRAESNRDYGSMGDVAEHASSYVRRGASQLRQLTRDHEGSAVLVALVAGLGVGVFIGSAMAAPHRQPKGWKDRLMAEGLGRRMLDRIEGMIPAAVAEHFGH